MADKLTHGFAGRRTADDVRETRRKAGRTYYQRHREEVLSRLSVRYDFDEDFKERVRKWRAVNPAKALLSQMRARKQHECSLTLEDVEALLEPMQCAETGLPLRWIGRIRDPLAPSPDRLDNSIGYVPGNVRIVAWFINNMRGDLPLDEFRELLSELGRALQKLV